jgi:type I restriction enzyme S subunit
MSRQIPVVRLGDVLDPVVRAETPTLGKIYRQIGVKLWGEGAYERESIDGGATKYAQLFRAEANDVIVNKIWARNGSVAVVDDTLAGTYGSNEFPMFEPQRDRVEPRWIFWLTKTKTFWEQCNEKSRGTSGQNRIRPEQFLEIEIPLPLVSEQRRIVAQIEELAAQIKEARTLRHETSKEAEALLLSRLNLLFGDPYQKIQGALGLGTWQRLDEVVEDVADGPHVTPTYVEQGIPFITVLNITSGHISFQNHKFITEADHETFQKRAKAQRGDVLISKDGTIGVPCVVDTDREFSFFVSVADFKSAAKVPAGGKISRARVGRSRRRDGNGCAAGEAGATSPALQAADRGPFCTNGSHSELVHSGGPARMDFYLGEFHSFGRGLCPDDARMDLRRSGVSQRGPGRLVGSTDNPGMSSRRSGSW